MRAQASIVILVGGSSATTMTMTCGETLMIFALCAAVNVVLLRHRTPPELRKPAVLIRFGWEGGAGSVV